jgi:hypothetical protein
MSKSRKIKIDKNYKPLPTNEGDEIYSIGIFKFNISKILEHIIFEKLDAQKEQINVREWFKLHIHGLVNEEYLTTVDIACPVIQAEIRPDMFENRRW